MTVTRRLAATLAAEVVGYTRLMEQHAFTALVRLLLAPPSRTDVDRKGQLLEVKCTKGQARPLTATALPRTRPVTGW